MSGYEEGLAAAPETPLAAGIAALADPWLDDIIRCLEVGMGKWQDEHRIPGQIGAWQFKGADGPFHELTQSTLRRLKDYRAAHKVRDAIPACADRRVIDLSIAAFERLAPWGYGVLPVTVELAGTTVALPETDR